MSLPDPRFPTNLISTATVDNTDGKVFVDRALVRSFPSYAFVSIAEPKRPGDAGRLGVVLTPSTLACVSKVKLPIASSSCCDMLRVKPFSSPLGLNGASWRGSH